MYNVVNDVFYSLQVDQDGDGAINFSEMLTIMVRMHKKAQENQDLMRVFEIMDKDGEMRCTNTTSSLRHETPTQGHV